MSKTLTQRAVQKLKQKTHEYQDKAVQKLKKKAQEFEDKVTEVDEIFATGDQVCKECAVESVSSVFETVKKSLNVNARSSIITVGVLVSMVIFTLLFCLIFSIAVLCDSSFSSYDCSACVMLTTSATAVVLASVLIGIVVRKIWTLPKSVDIVGPARLFNETFNSCVKRKHAKAAISVKESVKQ
jgi:hypothetical protein